MNKGFVKDVDTALACLEEALVQQRADLLHDRVVANEIAAAIDILKRYARAHRRALAHVDQLQQIRRTMILAKVFVGQQNANRVHKQGVAYDRSKVVAMLDDAIMASLLVLVGPPEGRE